MNVIRRSTEMELKDYKIGTQQTKGSESPLRNFFPNSQVHSVPKTQCPKESSVIVSSNLCLPFKKKI